ncbi:hypothetical protein [Naasia lichenicola]|uniref:Uncharacterized protein n=1 Tax=Naasia lichenicola TaxID=2565933 RepID=A0A4V3WT02_9MICO|nr:hypothetical protein [Naasia lichenicola]THG30117.1 hypothetical protein E6C64_15905 [Naasia lichenicola]
MAAEPPLTRAELAAKYPDEAWRRKLLDVLDLVSLLRNSIIDKSYRPSEELNAAVVLSKSGVVVSRRLTTQENVNAKDAHVLALLGLVHVDPLIDIDGLDLPRLERAISNEIIAGALRYPMTLGRELYDRAAELFPEERDYLNHIDTMRLMDGMDQGVFQAGHYLVGPYGIRRLPFARAMGPTTSVPLQHCADMGCGVVHRVQLTTSIEAGVNRCRRDLSKVLQAISDEPSAWNGFISDIIEDDFNSYEVDESATIEYILGDCFSNAELASLCIHAADTLEGKFQANATELGLKGKAKTFVDSLSRAQTLQLLMMSSDQDLATLIDSAVRDGIIAVPADEIRRPKVNGRVSSGAWRLRSQLSRLGIRALSHDKDLPQLRLSALARALFDPDSIEDMEELAWILRGITGDNAQSRLEEFLRTSDPRVTIETLILARRANATKVCADLGIDLQQDNSTLRDSILWKLGFPLPRSLDIRDEYWRLHGTLEGLAKTASVDLTSTAEGLRQASSDYFVSLERFLFDSLCFATWGLVEDHYSAENPFVYFEQSAREFAIRVLNESIDREEDLNSLTAEPTLSIVVEGFMRLSKLLQRLQGKDEELLRVSTASPKWAEKTSLQRFPFRHLHPFLDLLPLSQSAIIETLAEVGSDLNDSGIMTARNGLLHAKQRIPTVGEVEEAMRKARTALDRLESIGCVRNTFAVTSTQINAWGGATTVLASNGRTISFSSPSSFEWAKLPSLNRPHYLMQGAVFAAPNEMLRFSEGFASEYQTYWSKFPVRPEPGNRVVSTQSESLAASEETGTHSAVRAG